MGIGWLSAIIIGMVGAVMANAIFTRADIHVANGWLGYLVTGFIGSCILLFVAKLVRR